MLSLNITPNVQVEDSDADKAFYTGFLGLADAPYRSFFDTRSPGISRSHWTAGRRAGVL